MLGRPGQSESQIILTSALAGDCVTALATFETAYNRGAEPEMLVTDLLNLVHLASMQAAGGSNEGLIEIERDMLANLADIGIARLGRAWQLLLKGHAELGQAPNPVAACEMLIIRLAYAAQMPTPGELIQRLPKIAAKQQATKEAAHTPTETPSASLPIVNSESTMQAPQIQDEPATSKQLKPTLETPDLSMTELNSLSSIVNLAETNGEMLLAARIRNHVQLVSLKPGNLQITLVGKAPDQLASDIARHLSQWTNQRWLVSLSESGGNKTLTEQKLESDEKLREAISSEPLVARILDIFPGASIDEIKSPEMTLTSAAGSSDDALLLTEMNDADGGEMSG